MKKFITLAFSIIWVSLVMAKPYPILQYWFNHGDCTVFVVQIWDDMDTTDPTDDVLITTGTVSNCRGSFDLDDYEFHSTEITHMTFPSADKEMHSEPSLKLYPNPANKTVTIETSLSSDSHVMITDLSGSTVSTIVANSVSDSAFVVDVSHLSPGVYLVHAKEGNLVIYSRLVIQ